MELLSPWSVPPLIGRDGVWKGRLEGDMTPHGMLVLGRTLAGDLPLGIGYEGGETATLLARCIGCGCSSGGGEVLFHDGTNPASGVWVAGRQGLGRSLFVQQVGEVIYLHFFGREGRPLTREMGERLSHALFCNDAPKASGERLGTWDVLTGVTSAYGDQGGKLAQFSLDPPSPVALSVAGTTPSDEVLAMALERMGCVVLRKAVRGVPAMGLTHGGLRLVAWDEEGRELSPALLLAMVSFIEFEQGSGTVALPLGSPQVIEYMARQKGGTVLWLGRDGEEAERVYRQLPWLRDGLFAACRLCARLGQTGERLRTLAGRIPPFVQLKGEVPSGCGGESLEGLRNLSKGWVLLTPHVRRNSLRLLIEAETMEAAEELMAEFSQMPPQG